MAISREGVAQNVSVMDDARALHTHAKGLIPQAGELKITSFWVGVLSITHGPTSELKSEDFLWIKAKGTTTVQKIRDLNEQKHSESLRKEYWVLVFDSKEADLTRTVAEFDQYNDKCVIFETVEARQASTVTRLPLQSTKPHSNPQPPSTSSLNAQHSTIDGKPDTAHWNSQPANGMRKENTEPASAHPLLETGYQQKPDPLLQSAMDVRPVPSQRHSTLPQHHAKMPLNAYDRRPQTMDCPLPAHTAQPFPPAVIPGFASHTTTFPSQEMSLPGFKSYLPPGERAPHEQSARNARLPSTRHTSASRSLSLANEETTVNSTSRPGIKEEPPTQQSDPTAPSAEAVDEQLRSFQLQDYLKDACPEMLERSVEEGVGLLDDLRAPLIERMGKHPDGEQWLQQIENLKKQAAKTRTIIGVVGNTGAGKSSVINAMLDEERLVPTNCMRACTAVVTEISYNYETEPYRAQIEFITPADWEKELKTLFEDLFDGEGRISRECTNEDTDAGIAYAKIKAVYPKKTKEDISNSSPQKMLQEVAHILGTTRNIQETDSLLFYKKLQSYVDSKEKSTGKKDKDEDKNKVPKQMEFWPLIRVVRINVKSPALATGAVIVDLPGVHDANAARAAVAEGYMKKCTGLWIVAPINRAVDDKAAKSLLGESFKRQLKMDGGFNAVTFICSKTDDISLEEAQDSLGLQDQMISSWEEMDNLVRKQRSLKKQVENLQLSKGVLGDSMSDADEQIEIWDTLKEDLEGGKTVFAPEAKGNHKKRKNRRHQDMSSKKKRRKDDSDAEDKDFSGDQSEESADGDEADSTDSNDEAERPEPLTEDQIVAKIQELKESKKEARAQRKEIAENIKNLKLEIEEAKESEDNINSQLSALCISGRNKYSKGAIQQDFAAGIKEIDQELAAEEDEANFNPDVEIRDYEEVARGLPVFCVSSRGYQKLQGRLKKDPPVPGFTNVNETEIPQLQAHCEKLTENGRSASCRSFMNKLSQLLNSLVLWASSDGTGANLTPEQWVREDKHLQKGLKGLETGLEKAVKAAICELNAELSENVYEKHETAVSNATEAAVHTAQHWGEKVNRDNREEGGYFWATYKAICRRNGTYNNAQGPHDWNAKLVDPVMKILASGWEKAFSRRLPMVMANFTRDVAKRLRQFHKDVGARAQKIGTGGAGLHMLEQQVGVYESNVKDIAGAVKDKIIVTQKDINREFTPVIERAMEAAYNTCTEERGPGSFARMKAAMTYHIESERHYMFQRSVDEVKARLDALIKDVKDDLDDHVDEIFIQIRRDYRSVLGGGDSSKEGQLLPKAQRLVRKEVLQVLETCEKRFKRIAGIAFEDDEEEEAKEESQAENQVHHEKEDEKVKTEERANGEMANIEEDKIKQEAAAIDDLPNFNPS